MFHFSDSASEYKPWKIFLAMELTVHHTQKVNVIKIRALRTLRRKEIQIWRFLNLADEDYIPSKCGELITQ